MFIIEFYLDEKSTAQMTAYMQLLQKERVPTLLEHGGVPHITIAAFDEADEIKLQNNISSIFENIKSFEVHFESLGVFPETGVVYAAPTVKAHLLNLQRKVYKQLSESAKGDNAYFLPDAWIPHCTLVFHAAKEQLGSALDLLLSVWQPLTARLESVVLLELDTEMGKVKELLLHPLKS